MIGCGAFHKFSLAGGAAGAALAGAAFGGLHQLLHNAYLAVGQVVEAVHKELVFLQPQANYLVGGGESAESAVSALVADIAQSVFQHLLAEALFLAVGTDSHHAYLIAFLFLADGLGRKGGDHLASADALENAGVGKMLVLQSADGGGSVVIFGKTKLFAYGIVGVDDDLGAGFDIILGYLKNNKILHLSSVLVNNSVLI